MISKSYHVSIITVDNADPLDTGVSSIGGVVIGETDWAMRLPVKGEQLGYYVLEV